MTFDVLCNIKFSLCFTRKYKVIGKENLAVYQKSLSGFLQATLPLQPCLSNRGITQQLNDVPSHPIPEGVVAGMPNSSHCIVIHVFGCCDSNFSLV